MHQFSARALLQIAVEVIEAKAWTPKFCTVCIGVDGVEVRLPCSRWPMMAALQERIATATVDEELANDPKLAEEVDREVASKHFMP